VLRRCEGLMPQGYYDTQFSAAFGAFLRSRPGLLPPRVKLSMLLGVHLGHRALTYYGRAHNMRRRYRRIYDSAFREVDCLLMPTVPVKAPPFHQPEDAQEALQCTLDRKSVCVITRNAAPFNVTGHTALSVPCGWSDGLPIGMMLAGKHFDDQLVLRVGNAFELARESRTGGTRK